MAYSELVKNLERVRSYIRDFYVYGFKGRNDFDVQSARSYDNERRRLESWLKDYMSFRYDEAGKRVFLSVDIREISSNPLYEAFRAKSFTDLDIMLHFCILDILSDKNGRTVRDITTELASHYTSDQYTTATPDQETVRHKLQEYCSLGILVSERQRRDVLYKLSNSVDLTNMSEALLFFSEAVPLGVLGYYLSDKKPSPFRYKHKYLFSVLDSEIMAIICKCMENRQTIILRVYNKKKKSEKEHEVFPLRFYISTQSGRQYILGYHLEAQRLMFFRLDGIRKVSPGTTEISRIESIEEYYSDSKRFIWGVSNHINDLPAHIEIDIKIDEGEGYLVNRLYRERRNGVVERISSDAWRYSADVFDAKEMLPWIRTYIGRIIRIECSDQQLISDFREDLMATAALYEGVGK